MFIKSIDFWTKLVYDYIKEITPDVDRKIS